MALQILTRWGIYKRILQRSPMGTSALHFPDCPPLHPTSCLPVIELPTSFFKVSLSQQGAPLVAGVVVGPLKLSYAQLAIPASLSPWNSYLLASSCSNSASIDGWTTVPTHSLCPLVPSGRTKNTSCLQNLPAGKPPTDVLECFSMGLPFTW